MGNCLSLKKSNQQNQQDNSPSLAATLASTAANVVTDFIQSQQAPANAANSQYTNPSGLKVIENAYVFRMPDGDTFSCDYINDNGEKATARVRIMGIDCPESKQNFGQEAKEIGEKLIFRTSVTLYVHTTDRYGRIVADVITPKGLNYGEELLRQGAAWHYKQYDRRQEYADLETKAREQNIGLWSYPRPLQPWEYRRRQRDK